MYSPKIWTNNLYLHVRYVSVTCVCKIPHVQGPMFDFDIGGDKKKKKEICRAAPELFVSLIDINIMSSRAFLDK